MAERRAGRGAGLLALAALLAISLPASATDAYRAGLRLLFGPGG